MIKATYIIGQGRKMPLALGLACICIVGGCKSNNNGYDGPHLPAKVMQKVLVDVNLAESLSSSEKDSLHRHGEKNLDSLAVHYKEIFAHYKVTTEEFSNSLTWYKNHPEKLDTVYNAVLASVTKMQSERAAAKPGK